jgi:GNAT superfamily N-acetyltransferase
VTNAPVHVRPATVRDVEFIVEANRALAEESEGVTLDVETLRAGVRELLDSPALGRYWIAEIDGGGARGHAMSGGGATPDEHQRQNALGVGPQRKWKNAGQLAITYEWSDWRNRVVWWIQSVYVMPDARQRGVFRALYEHVRRMARDEGAAGLRLYVDETNTRGHQVYAAIGMSGGHYRVFEDMFDEPARRTRP